MNERRLFKIKSRRERYEVRDDVVDLKGFEPSTPTMRMWCAPNCATSPKLQADYSTFDAVCQAKKTGDSL